MNGEQILARLREITGDHSLGSYNEINAAYERICRRTGFWEVRERDTGSVAFRAGASRYTLPSDRIRRLEAIAVRAGDSSSDWQPMKEATDEEFDAESPRQQDGTSRTAQPRLYRLNGGAVEQLEVTPEPDGDYEVRLTYITNPEPLGRLSVPVLASSYHDTIAKTAAVEELRRPGRSEAEKARADQLIGDIRIDHLHLANDTAPNRAGVAPRMRRIMRS